jgi:hypothetical protein
VQIHLKQYTFPCRPPADYRYLILYSTTTGLRLFQGKIAPRIICNEAAPGAISPKFGGAFLWSFRQRKPASIVL